MPLENPGRRARRRLVFWLLLLAVILSGGLLLALRLEWRKPLMTLINAREPETVGARAPVAPSDAKMANSAVGCLGYIEPKDGMLQVTAPYFQGRPQRVAELKVREGDQVRPGQLLAVLDGRAQMESAIRLAGARVDLARAKLQQVQAGANPSDIAAQKAAVDQIQAALANARAEYQRFETLHRQTDVSAAELDARRLVVETDEQKLKEAEERLRSISQVRQTDVDVAQSEVNVAQEEEESARLDLRNATVTSPAGGRVMKIHAYPGEEVGQQGFLELGKTSEMYVEAEVYEADIARVHPGQHATITSDLFEGQLTGKVTEVGGSIAKASILPADPVSYADARVFKVWIRLDDGKRVAGLIHGKTNVVIQP